MAAAYRRDRAPGEGVEGYVGSALVGSETGMALDTDEGGADFNLDIVAAGNSEVVRAKRKTPKELRLKDELEDIPGKAGKKLKHEIRNSVP